MVIARSTQGESKRRGKCNDMRGWDSPEQAQSAEVDDVDNTESGIVLAEVSLQDGNGLPTTLVANNVDHINNITDVEGNGAFGVDNIRASFGVVLEVDAEVETVASTCTDDSLNGGNERHHTPSARETTVYAIDPISGQNLPVATRVGDVIESESRRELFWMAKVTVGVMIGFFIAGGLLILFAYFTSRL